MLHDTALFIGVESFTWQLPDFEQAAQFAKAHGVDILVVKVFDGANGQNDEWYAGIGGFAAVANTILLNGVQVLPYGYMYGDSHGSVLDLEIALVEKYMNTYGWFMADIETEWDGHIDWATRLNSALSTNQNQFFVSCLADPQPEQNQGAVFLAMAPSVNVWAPQVYDAFLNSVYASEFGQIAGSLCLMPTVEIGGGLPGNDPVAFLKNMPATPISIWEYQHALANPATLDQIVSLVKSRSTMTALTSTGEVMALNQADQFQPAKSQFECGFFACAVVRSGAPPGQQPIRTVQQVIDDGEMWYAQYDGSNDISNMDGMSLQQEYDLIHQMTYDYRPVPISGSTIDYIRAWVKLGYPVIITGAEIGFYDMGLGDVVPYPWHPTGNHIITVTGIASDGNFIVRDTANVTDLFNPTTLRPGPRKYDVSKMGLVSATAVVMPWLPKPPTGFDPTKENTVSIPAGWSDVNVNGDMQLHNPTNQFVVRGAFRLHIINSVSWAEWNVPLENEHNEQFVEMSNQALGPGAVQLFMDSRLEMLSNQGNRILEGWFGRELQFYMALAASFKSQLDAETAKESADQATITDLQAQLAACMAALSIPADLQSAINTVASIISTVQKYAK